MSIVQRARKKCVDLYEKFFDPRRLEERKGSRIPFHPLRQAGFFSPMGEKRILEIGPKHGLDSRLLAGLNPKELVLLDLPSKKALAEKWLSDLPGNVRYYSGNINYLSPERIEELGLFDLIWFTGVLYHNAEQLRMLCRLFDLCAEGGTIVLESATTRSKKLARLNVVELHWPKPYRGVQTITHLPSKKAISSWLEMAGFSQVRFHDVYSRRIGKDRCVLSARKEPGARSYIGYSMSGLNPEYKTGKAT